MTTSMPSTRKSHDPDLDACLPPSLSTKLLSHLGTSHERTFEHNVDYNDRDIGSRGARGNPYHVCLVLGKDRGQDVVDHQVAHRPALSTGTNHCGALGAAALTGIDRDCTIPDKDMRDDGTASL